MNFLSTILGLVSGATFGATANTITEASGWPWWAILLISIVPTIIGAVVDVLTAYLKNKGVISEKTAETIQETTDKVLSEVEEVLKNQQTQTVATEEEVSTDGEGDTTDGDSAD